MEKGKGQKRRMQGTLKCFVHLNDYKNVISGILMRSWEPRKKHTQKLEAHKKESGYLVVLGRLEISKRIMVAQWL